MNWIETIVTALVGLIGAVGGGGIIYWGATRKMKNAEANKSTTEARMAEADLVEQILEKYEKGILAHMESGDAVRKQEFQELTKRLDRRFDIIENEDKKQNEIIRDIAEYLNGGFQKFEASKRRRAAREEKKQNKSK